MPPRLRTVMRELIEVERAKPREIAALRSELASLHVELRPPAAGHHIPPPLPIRHRARRTRLAAGPGNDHARQGERNPHGGSSSQAAGPLFGKRGLKKVHRAGCIFGERIHAEDRVFFHSMARAAAAGYEACKICRPGG